MQHARILCVVLAVLLCAAVSAQTPPKERIELPDLPSADMRLAWTDFQELLRLVLEKQEAEKREPEKEPPAPWPFTVQETRYQAAAGPGTLRIDAEIVFHVWTEDWIQLPVLGTETALESATLDGGPCHLVNENKRHVLPLKGAGDHTLRVTFYVATQEEKGVVSTEFDCVPAPLAHMTLLLPLPEAAVSAPGAASVHTEQHEDGVRAELAFRPTETIALSWRLPAPKEPEPEPEPEEPKPEPRITCATTLLASISESNVACDAVLQFQVLRGETNRFHLRLDADAQLLRLEGEGAEFEVTSAGGTQHIEVAVNHSINKNYTLQAEYERPIPDGAAAVVVPPLWAEGLARHTGYIGVATAGNIEITAAPELEHLRRVDTKDLPAQLRGRSVHPILHAFRYNEDGYLLPFDYHRLEDAPVRVAGIDQAQLMTVVTEQGLVIHRAQYLVRNRFKKFLRVHIGEGAEVWGARVGDDMVRPALAAAKDGEEAVGDVLIPLRRSDAGPKAQDVFPVELVYMDRRGEPPAWGLELGLDAPRPDLLVNRLHWEVLLPEDWHLYRSEGDVRPAPEQRLFGAATYLRPRGKTEKETIYRLREGIERFFITDINNPAASAHGPRRYDPDKKAAAPKSRLAPAAQTVAGVLPIEVDIPRVGRAYQFGRTVIPKDTPLHLNLKAVTGRATHAAVAACFACLLLVGFIFGLAAARARRRGCLPLRGFALASIVALPLLAAAHQLGAANWASALGLLAGVVLGFLLALKQRAATAERGGEGPDHA